MEGPRRLARYTFLGFDPEAIVHSANNQTEVLNREKSERKIETNANPLATLGGILPNDRGNQARERYTGGLVGYASYDLASSFEKIPRNPRGRDEFPDMEFGLYLDGIVFDHYKNQVFYFYRNKNRIEDVRSIINDRPVNREVFFGQPKPNLDHEKFCSKVGRAKEYIRSGDIFQVVISKRYKIPFKGSLVAFYKQLRRINPSPYMYYLKFGQRQIVGSSPEMLARK
ncbi:chorismate-binding protein, partial [Candidatus Bathyarchaeota archaeon]|nr:chorismate-binding protein [Candidatus Bathyarchaeota archaeon]